MSENINSIIFKKIKVLNELKEDFKRNIKLLYFFRDSDIRIRGGTYVENIILVTNDDEVYCCGCNSYGLLGFGHKNRIEEFIINEDLSNKNIIKLNNNDTIIIALTFDGNIYCWGYNGWGGLGIGSYDGFTHKPELNEYLLNEKIIDISCGRLHTLALTSNGDVYAWGQNPWGQIGNENKNKFFSLSFKIKAFNGEKVKSISCGSHHSMTLTENGRVFSWGYNRCGQLGIGTEKDSYTPKLIYFQKNVIIDKISCGEFHSLLLSRERDIYVFGWNNYNQLGINTDCDKQLIPIKMNFSQKFVEIASHHEYSISSAYSENGLYYVWGECGNVIIRKPKETQFKSFQELFNNYFELQSKCDSFKRKKYSSNFSEITKLGSGSFGTVFKVKHNEIDEIFAIKKINSRNIDQDIYLKELNISLIILKLENEFLVKYHDFWVERDEHAENLLIYIQMDLCDKTLAEIHDEIKKDSELCSDNLFTRLGFHLLSGIFIEILKGVKYLHSINIIHRDLKPVNILLKNGRIKIADFGLAKFYDLIRDPNIRNTGNIGDIKYAASEVLEFKYYDEKADIYSLGKILNELFEIEAKKSNQQINDEKLKQKYENLEELMERMINRISSERPNCEQILTEKEFWGLNEINIEEEIDNKEPILQQHTELE